MFYLEAVWTLPTYLRRSIIGHNVNKSFSLPLSLSLSVSLSPRPLLSAARYAVSRPATVSARIRCTYHPPTSPQCRAPLPIVHIALYTMARPIYPPPVFTINYIILIVSLATWRSCFESVHARRLTLPRFTPSFTPPPPLPPPPPPLPFPPAYVYKYAYTFIYLYT